MEFSIISVLVLIANIYAIYNIVTSGASTMAKVVWTLAILILPILGLVIWLIIGPKGNRAAA